MQLLKGIVVGMGFLIVLAMGLIAWGFHQKANDPGFKLFRLTGDGAAPPAAPPVAPTAVPPVAPFGDIRVSVPEGCSVAGMVPAGDRLFLRLGPEGRCDRVVVIDLTRGAVLGTVAVGP